MQPIYSPRALTLHSSSQKSTYCLAVAVAVAVALAVVVTARGYTRTCLSELCPSPLRAACPQKELEQTRGQLMQLGVRVGGRGPGFKLSKDVGLRNLGSRVSEV